MKSLYRLASVALLGLTCLTAQASAHSYTLGQIDIGHPWARASAGNAPAGAAYLTLTNTGSSPDRLISASSPAAEKVQIHTHLMEDGVMKMRALDGVDVDPGAPLEFKPGGLHIMLIGLKEPLKQGTSIPLTLTFKNAGSVQVSVQVDAVSAMTSQDHMGHMGHQADRP